VTHGIDDVVDANPEAQGGILFRILRVVRMLPEVAMVHVAAKGAYGSAVVVVNAALARFEAVTFINVAVAARVVR